MGRWGFPRTPQKNTRTQLPSLSNTPNPNSYPLSKPPSPSPSLCRRRRRRRRRRYCRKTCDRSFLLHKLNTTSSAMEEQFILRVPPTVSERIERLLNENADASEDLDLSFSEDGRNGTFAIGNDRFPVSLLDLPCIIESYKTYDDNVLIKTADIGQIIMVREQGDPALEDIEYRHGLTPPMRDARRRRFRREPDLNPELVQRVEKDLLTGGTAENVEVVEHEEDGYEEARNARGKNATAPSSAKPGDIPAGGITGEPDRSDSDESDDSM